MNVAAAQINPTTGDIQGNTEQIIEYIQRAADNGADLVVFPELCIPGYMTADLLENDRFIAANEEAVERVAAATADTDVAVIVGYAQQQDNDLYNAAAVLHNGEIQTTRWKTLLPSYRYFDDQRYFTPATNNDPVSLTVNDEEITIGVTICEDMWDAQYDEKPVPTLLKQGVDLLVNINASPFTPAKPGERHQTIQRHLQEYETPFVYVNTVGAADNNKNVVPFDGQSLVYNTEGDLITVGPRFEEALLTADPFQDTDTTSLPQQEREAALYTGIVAALRDYAAKTGFDEAVVPVSGGIDSALGLAVTVDAFGPDNVTAYTLPSAVNTSETVSLAKQLAENLDVELVEIPVQDLYDRVLDTYTEHATEVTSDTARENVYARVRGLLMMLTSNNENALLITNGNETELALGYVTLYGDMAGGIAPLGDLSKTDVYTVARHVNNNRGGEVIPEEIFDLAPSAELKEDQEDPFDYPVVAPLVDMFLEERVDPSTLVKLFEQGGFGGAFPDDLYDRYDKERFTDVVYDTYNRIRTSSYKRAQAPPVIAVSERAFGFDLRETIINQWRGGGFNG